MRPILASEPREQWPGEALDDLLCDAQSGFASGERASDGVIQLRMNNVSTDGTLNLADTLRVPASKAQVAKYRLLPGDVLFNSTNSPELVGKTTIFPGYPEPVVFSNHFLRLRVDSGKLDPRYLARWFTHQWNQRVFQGLCTQWVNQAAVRKDDLLALKVPLPPLPEQRRIAAILERADRLRRLRRYALELSAGYLQAVFVEMFGDPVRNPNGWKIGSIGDVLDSSQYGTSQKSNSEQRGYPVLGMGNITYSGSLDLTSLAYVDLTKTEFESLRLQPGDIIFNRTNSTELVGKTAHWNIPLDAVIASYLVKLRLKQGVRPEYFTVLLNSPYYKHLFRTRCKEAIGQSNVSPTLLAEFPVMIPPVLMQQEFAHIAWKHDRLRAQQREAARQAEQLFGALLNRAFRGEL